MGNKIIPCGGWYVNDEHFTITYQNGKPIIDIIPEEAIVVPDGTIRGK